MLELRHVTKRYQTASGTVHALRDVCLKIQDGEIFGVIGMSGAGKSTLVRCINMLDRPDSGEVLVDGRDVAGMSSIELRDLRRGIAMISQRFDLLKQRTCQWNVEFPLKLDGIPADASAARARELLSLVGLEDKADAYPVQLSGGQQQRVAIARAIASDPKILLCDEATSALDPATTSSILDLIREINSRFGITVIMITHQMNVVESICGRAAILDRGTVAEEGAVREIFAAPRSAVGRSLLYPDLERTAESFPRGPAGLRAIQLTFSGAGAAGTPLIARMAIEIGAEANIAYASTRLHGERVYGSMVVLVDACDVERVMDFVSRVDDVTASEVKNDDRPDR